MGFEDRRCTGVARHHLPHGHVRTHGLASFGGH
jgi:hypothetical protein